MRADRKRRASRRPSCYRRFDEFFLAATFYRRITAQLPPVYLESFIREWDRICEGHRTHHAVVDVPVENRVERACLTFHAAPDAEATNLILLQFSFIGLGSWKWNYKLGDITDYHWNNYFKTVSLEVDNNRKLLALLYMHLPTRKVFFCTFFVRNDSYIPWHKNSQVINE